MIQPICDFDFMPGQTALFCYDCYDNKLMVKIIDKTNINGEEWYLVSANKVIVEKLKEIDENEYFTGYYKKNIDDNEVIFLVDPDELEPNYRQLTVISEV